MSIKEKLIEGKFDYIKDGHVYSEEEFIVEREDKSQGNYYFRSEVLSRLRTGEFLKIYVDYELNHQFTPLNVTIRRRLGDRSSNEVYNWDYKTKNLHYEFEDTDGKRHFYEQVVNSKSSISTPCLLTSMIMLNHRKLDPVHGTPYQIITTNNLWSYEAPFIEGEMYIELTDLDQQDIRVKGQELRAHHCKMYHVNEAGTISEHGDDIYLSKHYFIPYRAQFQNNIVIEVAKLKVIEDQFSKR